MSKNAKKDLIEEIVKQIIGDNNHLKDQKKNLFSFINSFFSGTSYSHLRKMPKENLNLLVMQSWKFIENYYSQDIKILISTHQLASLRTPRTLIHILNTDKQFLINTIKNVLNRHNISVEIMCHPVLLIERDKKGKLIEFPDVSSDGAKRSYESVVCIQVKGKLTEQESKNLSSALHEGLTCIKQTVDDWPQICGILDDLSDQFQKDFKQSELKEDETPLQISNFLKWLKNRHFVFIGARFFPAKSSYKESSIICFESNDDSKNLGLFRYEGFLQKSELVPGLSRATYLRDASVQKLENHKNINIVKTSLRSPVHRASRLDSIEVIVSKNNQVHGVWQFIGFLAKAAYTDSAFNIPLVNKKVRAVFERFGLQPQWHDGKTLFRIIDSIPRDELLHLSQEQIYNICAQTLDLNEYGHMAAFIRQDPYGAYTIAMIYLTRSRYHYTLNEKFNQILSDHLGGVVTSSHTQMGDLPFVRLIFVITHSTPKALEYCHESLHEDLLEASMLWDDRLALKLQETQEEDRAGYLYQKYSAKFPDTYKEQFSAEEGWEDIAKLEELEQSKKIVLSIKTNHLDNGINLKFFHPDEPLSLYKILPLLQNLGIDVITEHPYCLKVIQNNDPEEKHIWIHACYAKVTEGVNVEKEQEKLIDVFQKIWALQYENDSLNQLVLKASLNGLQVFVLRAYARYLKQIQSPYSLQFIEETLVSNLEISKLLIGFFEAKFGLEIDDRKNKAHVIYQSIIQKLGDVKRLEHEKIFSAIAHLIAATLRTNYAQLFNGENQSDVYLSLKFDCTLIDDLPNPKPLYEIFVYSARTEAVHLRGGKVARGGIRWSDRLEDYRTEILGLLKAQMVKNSVIVPLGAKGGFVVKRQDQFQDRAQLNDEVIACYKIMISALLDITDSVELDHKGNQTIVEPEHVVRWDENDPYLVVAADKGTATFSDIANSISAKYGFWLDDAFASGGSAGYDHKKMAITTRGAWESVKRHFRELNKDVQSEPFTIIGVGDMSGDVFGNAMLRSKTMLLQAAFNHMHIFIDPNPNPLTSYEERLRLFELPRSTWADYNTNLISFGGGVFSRQDKKITLTPQMKELFSISKEFVSPDELIHLILTMPIDLLWFGGIGTFVKDRTENHFDVGDMQNNRIRINAHQLRARVVAEGANLGMTQKARIAFAISGGRINTDAIDNSAGVDCSDHEVNIKILLKALEKAGKIDRKFRDQVLRDMTDEVAELVLRDNYLQTQILSLMELKGPSGIPVYHQLMKNLEHEGNLNCALESLPDDEQIEKRIKDGQGFTRPELAILLAYSKITLYNQILASELPDLPKFEPFLLNYFPIQLQQDYSGFIRNHLLRREIIATMLTNLLINRVGPDFVYHIQQITGEDKQSIVKSFISSYRLLDLEHLWSLIEALDDLHISPIQLNCLAYINTVISQSVIWFLKKGCGWVQSYADKSFYQDLLELRHHFLDYLTPNQRDAVFDEMKRYQEQKLPMELAQNMASLLYLPALLDIVDLSRELDESPSVIAQAYFNLSERLELQSLLRITRDLNLVENWQNAAQAQLIYDLMKARIKLTSLLLRAGGGHDENIRSAWYQKNHLKMDRFSNTLNLLKQSSHYDLALISFAIRELEDLTASIK